MHADPILELLARLKKVKEIGPDQWKALCPAHDDHKPSLSIGRGQDGRALVTCHAGCDTVDVLSAVGLSVEGMFPDGSNLRDYGQKGDLLAKKLPKNDMPCRKIVAEYDYINREGELAYQVVRYEPKDFCQRQPNGKGWEWNMHGVQRILYRLPELQAADSTTWVFVVEGEKDADALAGIGLVATTNPGGAGKWGSLSDDSALKERSVAIIPDRDDTGRRHAHDVAARLQDIAADIRIVNLGECEDFTGKDVSDWLDWLDSKEPEDLSEALLNMVEAATRYTGEEWPKLVPLRKNMCESLSFPIEVLPSWLRDMVEGLAEATQTPLGLAGSIGLGILALVGAGKVEVEPKPGWCEPLSLFLAVALPSACRKSAVFRAMTAPIEKWERVERERLTPEIEKEKTERAILQEKLVKLKRKAANDDQQAETEALSLSVELSTKTVPVFPRLLAGDVTPEGVVRLLAEQESRLGVFSSEGGELTAIVAGRYSQNGQSNMEVFLKGHAGDAIRVDRANRDRAPIIVDHPALTIVLCVQPSVLEVAWQRQDFSDRGLLARFLYVLPPNPLGNRDVDPPCLAEQVASTYENAILCLLKLPQKEDEGNPKHLTLTSEAQDLLTDFMRQLEPELGPGGRYSHMTAWAGKLSGAIARIAGALHLAHDPSAPAPWQVPINADTVRAALTLGKFYAGHAERVQGTFGGSPATRMALRVLEWINRTLPKMFSERDLYRTLGARKNDVLEGLELLQETGHVRQSVKTSDLEGRPGRKPSPMWEVNPSLREVSVKNVNSVIGVHR